MTKEKAYQIARGLLGDGQGQEVNDNKEYARALVDFLWDAYGDERGERENVAEALGLDRCGNCGLPAIYFRDDTCDDCGATVSMT